MLDLEQGLLFDTSNNTLLFLSCVGFTNITTHRLWSRKYLWWDIHNYARL